MDKHVAQPLYDHSSQMKAEKVADLPRLYQEAMSLQRDRPWREPFRQFIRDAAEAGFVPIAMTNQTEDRCYMISEDRHIMLLIALDGMTPRITATLTDSNQSTLVSPPYSGVKIKVALGLLW